MAIRFRCPGCSAVVQVAEKASGRRARCPKCQTVVTVPAAAAEVEKKASPTPAVETLPSAEEEEAAVTETRPERSKKKSTASPTAKSRRYANDEDDDRPRRKPVKKSSSVGPVALLSVLGVVVLGCMGCMGLGGWWVYDRAQESRAEIGAPNQGIGLPPPPPFGGNDPNEQWNPAGGPGAIGQPPMAPWQPPQPPKPEPTTRVALAGGKFDVDIPAGARPADANNFPTARRYQFDAKASAVYRVTVTGSPETTAQVEAPTGPLPQQHDRFGNEFRQDFAFQAVPGGAYTVALDLPRFGNPAIHLSVREMDGSEPLPDKLKLTPKDVPLPQLTKAQELNVYEKKSTGGAAFAPDNKSFWIAHDDGTLSFWEHPNPLNVGSYQTKERLVALGMDRKGRLYAQATQERGRIRPGGERMAGDISVWEGLRPTQEKMTFPAPAKRIPLRGVVQRFINAPDGRWLYYLDTHNRKLGRIDAEKAAIDKEIDTLSPGTRAFCLTPDGKTIYCCSDSNRIDVIDAAEFKRTRTVVLDRGQPTDVAASNEGLVFLVGQRVPSNPINPSNCLMVDLRKGAPEQAKVTPTGVGTVCQCVTMLPDQRAVLFSGDRRIIACSLPSDPGLFRCAIQETSARDYFTPGRIVVSPDGRTVLHDSAAILSVSR